MSFTRYLEAKVSVDDRALNAHVWQTFVHHWPDNRPVRVLEVGGGIGTMAQRLHTRGVLRPPARYTLVDEQAENIAAAARRLAPLQEIDWDLETADIFDFIARRGGRAWDVLIAHAVLDLFALDKAVPRLLNCLRPGGVFYFTINFDGVTTFQPEVDRALDDRIEAAYHRTMDERLTRGQPSGDSRAGRHLIPVVRQAGAHVLAAGASDWVVLADPHGHYPADEAFFLRFILDTVRGALTGHPDLEPADVARWLAAREAQLARGELVYLAHQLDVVGRVPPR